MQTKFTITGLKEARQILQRMPDRVQKRVTLTAVRAGAREVRNEIVAAAPRGEEPSRASAKYGRLHENIRTLRLRRGPKDWVGVRVDTGDAFWGHILEFGSKFMPARPWFRPAVDASYQKAMTKIRDALGRGVEREAKKLASDYKTARKFLR